MEREYFEKEEAFETLNTKVKEMEMKLNEKDQQTDNLLGRLQKVDDKFTDLERDLKNCEKNQLSENGATTMKTCEKCEFKTLLESDLEKHIGQNHVDVFKCEFCEFNANLEGELKTHLRSKHINKINQFD